MIDFFVPTKPQPQGSIRAFMIGGKPRLTSDNAKLKPYRKAIAVATMLKPLTFIGEGPVSLRLEFTFLRPKSAPRTRQAHTVKPDIDKLVRSVLDALTGVLYADDSQVVELTARKVYGEVEGVRVIAEESHG